MKGDKKHNRDFLEILFENRNKGYGAFQLRKQYHRRMIMALIISCWSILCIAFLPEIINYFNRPNVSDDISVLTDPVSVPLLHGEDYSPPLPAPPKPQVQQNTVPVVAKDTMPQKKDKDLPKPDKSTANNKDPNAKGKSDDTTGHGKPNGGNPDGTGDGKIWLKVDNLPRLQPTPQYKDIAEFIQKNIRVPESEIEMKHFGTVVVKMVARHDGTVTDVGISKGVSPALNAEAMRVVRSLPVLIPPMRNGHPVDFWLFCPVTFSSQQSMVKK